MEAARVPTNKDASVFISYLSTKHTASLHCTLVSFPSIGVWCAWLSAGLQT